MATPRDGEGERRLAAGWTVAAGCEQRKGWCFTGQFDVCGVGTRTAEANEMPGGPRRIEGRDYYELPRVVPPLVLSEEELRWDEAMHVLRRARSFQRRAKALTLAHGISFARWEVLEVTERLIREKDDVVCQLEVAARAELAKGRVSESMRALMMEGLVDIAPDCWGISDRILMTDKGEELITSLRGSLVEVARVLGEPVTRAQR